MSELAFHTGVTDRFLYACRALKKAQRMKMSACVLLETLDDLDRFDKLLWSFDNLSFIPHGKPETPEIQRGAFVIANHPNELPDADLLLLLTHQAPKNVIALSERFPKIIDIVGADDPELTEGRNRYRSYRAQNLTPKVVNPKA